MILILIRFLYFLMELKYPLQLILFFNYKQIWVSIINSCNSCQTTGHQWFIEPQYSTSHAPAKCIILVSKLICLLKQLYHLHVSFEIPYHPAPLCHWWLFVFDVQHSGSGYIREYKIHIWKPVASDNCITPSPGRLTSTDNRRRVTSMQL